MSDKELTIEDLGEEIKRFIEKEAMEKYEGKQCFYKLKSCGFGLRINIILIEEGSPLYCTIARKPVYRRPKIIKVSNGFTNFDFDFFQKFKIFPPHEPTLKKSPPEEDGLLKVKVLIMGALDSKTGCYYKLMLKKYGVGMRIQLSIMQENNPRLIIEEKIIKIKPKKSDSAFSAYDLEFLGKNGLMGF